MYIITIDSGTTNSRIYLIDEESKRVIDMIKKNVGVRNTAIEGNTKRLKTQLSDGIKKIIEDNKCSNKDIRYIVATGMITSNLGLYEVPHLFSPASIKDFVSASPIKILPEFLDIPCIFVPGLQNSVHYTEDVDLYEKINKHDVMRGEEVETFGLMKQLKLKKGNGLMVLPGSHTKFVLVRDSLISSCFSTLCGEMLYALQKDTILSSSLNQKLVREIDRESLLSGFESGFKYGLSRAFYQIRLLELYNKANENQRANFFVGSILSADISVLQSMYENVEFDWIVVGGGKVLKKSFIHIFNYLNIKNVIEASEEQVNMSTVFGAKDIGDMKFYK